MKIRLSLMSLFLTLKRLEFPNISLSLGVYKMSKSNQELIQEITVTANYYWDEFRKKYYKDAGRAASAMSKREAAYVPDDTGACPPDNRI